MISISNACLQLELTDNEQYDFRINNLTKTAIALIQAYEDIPKFKQAFIKAFDRMLVTRKNKNLETSWKNGEEVFNWWIG